MRFRDEYDGARALAQEALEREFTRQGLEEAMRYSLLAGGKRVRPVLTIKFCEAAGGRAEEALRLGCAIEMLHTYSLIHDDLPAMDNDDLRRGKPTNHKVFGECTAILAGDALQSAAFRTAAEAGLMFSRPEAGLEALRYFAEAAGERGMCLGQYGDTTIPESERTAEVLLRINDLKTGALLRAACVLGVLASKGNRPVGLDCVSAAEEYALNLGRAFQIKDDMLDAMSTDSELGKPVGSDLANGKATYMSILGAEKCAELVREYTERAKAALGKASWAGDAAFLFELADELGKRSS